MLALRIRAMRQQLKTQRRELAEAVHHIRGLATRDELTGLPNRRYMQEAMRLACLNAQRSERPLLLAQLDLDDFKRVNDTHGHAVGDAVLQAFCATAQGCIRATDVLARWGGEEFLLMLVGTTAGQGTRLLERLREAVAAMALALEGGGSLRITVSIGAAMLRADEPFPARAVLPDAGHAVYVAAGGNNTCAIIANGSVYCWGANGNGQIGAPTGRDRPTPTLIEGLGEQAVALAVMDASICALLRSGNVRCWGDNLFGQLGRGTRDSSNHVESAPVVFE